MIDYLSFTNNIEKKIPISIEPESVSERLAKEEMRKLKDNTKEIEKIKEIFIKKK